MDAEALPAAVAVGSPEWTRVEEGAQVIAKVGGAPITASMVERVQAASPELSAEEALERLIDLEVLSQYGQVSGLQGHVRVRQMRQQALVECLGIPT